MLNSQFLANKYLLGMFLSATDFSLSLSPHFGFPIQLVSVRESLPIAYRTYIFGLLVFFQVITSVVVQILAHAYHCSRNFRVHRWSVMRHQRNIDVNQLAAQMQPSTTHRDLVALVTTLIHIFMRLTNANAIQMERSFSGKLILTWKTFYKLPTIHISVTFTLDFRMLNTNLFAPAGTSTLKLYSLLFNGSKMSSLCETVGKKFTVRARERDALAIIYMGFFPCFCC